MEHANKPSTIVTILMWLQMTYLILGFAAIVAAFLLILIQGDRPEANSLLGVTAVMVLAGLGVFTARSILRGQSWAWWLEIIYTMLPVSIAIDTISKFRGFTPVTEPQVFMRETMAEAVDLVAAPFLLATPFICVWMAIKWRRREVASKGATEEEPT